MAELTTDGINLLDKLYNLRGEESIITTSIDSEIKSIISSKEETERIKREQEIEKTNLEQELSNFTIQASNFLNTFSKFDDESFKALNAIGINIELGTLVNKVNFSIPKYEEDMTSKINNSNNIITEQNSNLNQLENNLADARYRMSDAEDKKERLNNLLNDILVNKDDSYNRSYVKKILDDLGTFNDEEMTTLEFLILFPERGLYEYEDKYKNRPDKQKITIEKPQVTKTIIEKPVVPTPIIEKQEIVEEKATPVIEEVKRPIVEEPKTPVIEEKKTSIIVENSDDEEVEINFEAALDPIIAEQTIDIKSPIIKEPIINPFLEVDTKSSLEIKNPIIKEETEKEDNSIATYLNSIGLNESIFNAKSLKLLEMVPRNTIKLNNETLKSIDFSKENLAKNDNGYMLLTDKELSQKINYLRGKGINDKTIKKELEAGNFQESFQDLQNKIDALKENGIEITEENIGILKLDVARYYDNVDILNKAGIELDEKEARNYKALLSKIPFVKEDTNILKDYLIKIVRKNGKYALDIFWNNPIELSQNIDELVENNLEKLIESTPEVLGKKTENILKMVKYCHEHNLPLIDDESQSLYFKYTYDYAEFKKLFKDANLPLVVSKEENNQNLENLLNNEIAKNFVTYLNESYLDDNNFDYKDITKMSTYNNIINKLNTYIGLNAKSGNTYEMNGIYISKNKIERNVAFIIRNMQKNNINVEGLELYIVLVSALYNLRLNANDMGILLNNYLGNNR